MRNGFRFAFFICVIRNLLCTLQTMYGLAPSTARTCLPAQSCDNHTKFGTLFQNAIRHIYTILRNITTKNYCTNPYNPTNGSRGEQRSPVSFPAQLLDKTKPSRSPKRAVEGASPYIIIASPTAAKSLSLFADFTLYKDIVQAVQIATPTPLCLCNNFAILLFLFCTA